MKTRAGYVVKKFNYGIGWRILDETGEVDTRPNGVVELSEPEVLIWNKLTERYPQLRHFTSFSDN